MTIYDELAAMFAELGYEWKLDDDTYVIPDAHDIEKVVDRASGLLYASANGSTIETGRLIVQKVSPTNFAIYLHIGDTK